jgi:hypothetical protein
MRVALFQKLSNVLVSTLIRGFLSRNLSTMRQAFITYIRPIVEYNFFGQFPSCNHL